MATVDGETGSPVASAIASETETDDSPQLSCDPIADILGAIYGNEAETARASAPAHWTSPITDRECSEFVNGCAIDSTIHLSSTGIVSPRAYANEFELLQFSLGDYCHMRLTRRANGGYNLVHSGSGLYLVSSIELSDVGATIRKWDAFATWLCANHPELWIAYFTMTSFDQTVYEVYREYMNTVVDGVPDHVALS